MTDKKVSQLVEATDLTGATFLIVQGGALKKAPATLLLNSPTIDQPTLVNPTLTLKQSAAPTPTAEGDIRWDTDDDIIVVGDGSGQKRFYPILSGTFTPAFSSTGATFNYAAQQSTWTRIGNRVFINFRIELATTGNTLTANALSITGLPFASAETQTMTFNLTWGSTTTAYVYMRGNIAVGATTLTLSAATAAATASSAVNSNNLHATNGSSIAGSISYAI